MTDDPPKELLDAEDDEETLGFALPDGICEHLEQEDECPVCRTRLLPGAPGRVRVSRDEITRGTARFNYLALNGPDITSFYLATEGLGPEEIERTKGLCALPLLELQRRTALASRRNADDYDLTGPVCLFAFLAGRANVVNHIPERVFSWFSNGKPRWFGTHVAIVGPKRRGKGNELDFVEELYAPALGGLAKVVRVTRVSVPGVFSGTDSKGARVDGDVIRAQHGVVLWPELGNLRGLLAGNAPGDAAGLLAEFLSSGRYTQSLLKGRFEYTSYATFVGAVQPDLWDAITESVVGIETRFVFGRLPPLSAEETVGRLKSGSEGHPLDPLAVKVFAARVAAIYYELKPTSFNVQGVETRLAEVLAEEPSLRLGADDLQRWIALATGAFLATIDGSVSWPNTPGTELTGEIVLPDPWSIESLRKVLEEDAKTRDSFRLDPGERRVREFDNALGDPRFSGTTDPRVPHEMSEICAYLAARTGCAPSTARKVVMGYRESGAVYNSFFGRRILDVVDPELLEATQAGEDAVDALPPEERANEVRRREVRDEAVRSARRGRGRPAKLYAWVPPGRRFFPIEEERGERP